MITGNLGKPGGGVNPLRGQNNVQGACDMGAGPDDLPGYQKVADPEVLRRFERAWGASLPRERGLKATECFPAMLEGRVRGLFLFGEDPVRTDPDTGHVLRALAALDFLVGQDLFLTETAKLACFPAAATRRRRARSRTPSAACSACARPWRGRRGRGWTPTCSRRS